MNLPPEFTRTILDVHGEAGAAWLRRLPELLAECERRWGLRLEPPFPLSYHYVAPAVRADGSPVVAKLGVPGDQLFLNETACLRLGAGRGMARLLEAEETLGLMLLERLLPGTSLRDVADDEQATRIAAGVMPQIWQPVPTAHHFPTAAGWALGLERLRRTFDGGTGPFPAHLVEMAEALFRDLLASQAEPRLLHGDLHHENILRAERQSWLALDPQGVVGEPAYETGALLCNRLPPAADWPELRRILVRRTDVLSEALGLDRRRIVGWGLAQAVLSAWWTYEDHGQVDQPVLACAQALAQV